VLDMAHTPRSLIIYGAGVIGCEYASMFAGLGIKVDLIDTRDRLLSFLDHEISDALSYHLREGGVMVRHQEEFASLETGDQSVTLHLKSGKRIHADALLWSNGRTGNTDTLSLANAGLEANNRGQLVVGKDYHTEVEHIYAVGDVIGWPSLASASYDQGREVAESLAGGEIDFIDDIPTGIYKISGEEVGMLKILFHIDTLEILGLHCFGAQASEIIHIGQAIMKQKGNANTIEYFVNTTFNYPTMAEAYRIAALAGLNRVKGFTQQ